MSTHSSTEDLLVEQPAIGLFAELGWQMVSALDERLGSLTADWERFFEWKRIEKKTRLGVFPRK